MSTDIRVLVDREGLRLVARGAAGEGEDELPAAQAAARVSWRDEPLLSHYAWRWWGADGTVTDDGCVVHEDAVACRAAWEDADGRPVLLVLRRIRAHARGWTDELEFTNPGGTRQALTIELNAVTAEPAAQASVSAGGLRFAAGAANAQLTFDALAAPRPDGADWELSLAPGERVVLRAELSLPSA